MSSLMPFIDVALAFFFKCYLTFQHYLLVEWLLINTKTLVKLDAYYRCHSSILFRGGVPEPAFSDFPSRQGPISSKKVRSF